MQTIMPYVYRAFYSSLNALTDISLKISQGNDDKRKRKIDCGTLQLGYNVLCL